MSETERNERKNETIERIARIIRSWMSYDDDDRNSKYDKNFAARCVLAEIHRLIEEVDK